MSKIFKVKLDHDPAALIGKAREVAAKNGVRFDGDESGGHFSGHGIVGEYQVTGEFLSLNITRKPMILPWGVIESQLRNFFV